MTTPSSKPRRWVDRLLDRLTAAIVIGLVAVSGGLLAELNHQAQAEARVAPFAQGASGAG
jgi:hypothetical protein